MTTPTLAGVAEQAHTLLATLAVVLGEHHIRSHPPTPAEVLAAANAAIERYYREEQDQ